MSLVNNRFGSRWRLVGRLIAPLAALLLVGLMPAMGETVKKKKKQIIGATATIKEVSTGMNFAARVDTGAASCSIHTEKWEIKDADPDPVDNIGKSIRFLVANDEGESEWIETIISNRVRIRSSSQKDGSYHGRYKVRLTLEWNGFKKEVEVSLTDRDDMSYPMLIGRNYLRGDFLVDVAKSDDDD